MPADRQRQQLGPTGPDLDLGAHRRAGAAFEARGPAAVLYLLGPRRVDRREPVLPQPVPVESGVEVVPGQHLRVAALTRGGPGQAHDIRAQRSYERCAPRRSKRAPSAPAALIPFAALRSPRDSSPSTIDGLPSWYRN